MYLFVYILPLDKLRLVVRLRHDQITYPHSTIKTKLSTTACVCGLRDCLQYSK